ncbi:hypothetical protein ASF00_12875 [Sphingomonas sp. Leaf34]|uniref:hypothetical protein n=1 Tax=Sphingomonas sp. Leaf34 TaxID=1736216 RepID=UPI000714F5CB|nr:hypothetical protein [Sphingomonas sp. Leaf34]KQN27233.1 hypothetical protein ASF00_12875 [Sphingomonas sp. Leaf34]
MTQNTTLADIANEIGALDAHLSKINDLIDLIGQPAILKADEVAKSLADAKDRFADALANQGEVEREERLKAFTDIRIVATPGHNLMNTPFMIYYTRKTWDNDAKESLPKVYECRGFAGLDDAAYEYLVTVKPHLIPAEIMALAPGNAQEAFGLYFVGKQRGYVKGAAVAA